MRSSGLLIFDLDDTIFETRSIGQHHVALILDEFKVTAEQFYGSDETEMIVSDLWQYPFDFVASKYQFDHQLSDQFSASVNDLEYNLDIQTFDDFHHVKNIDFTKILVTTGFKKLQLAKIKALKIEQEFEAVFIDEVSEPNRKHKKGIFRDILKSSNTKSEDILVIGDNPNSELKAGRELGMKTIQVAKFDQGKSNYSDYIITDFKELVEIIATTA
ncbi:MAG: HAD family hydrolase [Cyclobacteriaceae bacterium]